MSTPQSTCGSPRRKRREVSLRLAVYENLPPGGAQRTSYEIGRELIARGHELDLFRLSTYPDKGSFDLGPEAGFVHVEPFRPLGGVLDARIRTGHFAPRSYTLFRPLKAAHRRMAVLIRSRRYDAVLLHPDAMTGAPYLLANLDGIPTVYYCQEPPRILNERTMLDQHRTKLGSSPPVIGGLRLLEDQVILGQIADEDIQHARQARVIAVNSVYSRERVWSAYARNAVVCYLGIDADRFTPAAGSPQRRREVIAFGAPMRPKGHDLIIEALATLPAESRPAFRAVLPTTADAGPLEALARDRGVHAIVEKGLSDDEIVERYRCALLTVCAGRLEPFGLTAIESMACATPVVAIREAGFRESVSDGITGFLVEPEPKSIAAGIQRFASDPALAAKIGQAGRRDVVERWTWKKTASEMESILQEAAAN